MRYSVKNKPINYCDGSPLYRKDVYYSNNYASFVTQHNTNNFLDISMALNDYIMAVDSTIEYFYATHPDISLCVFLTINRINGIREMKSMKQEHMKFFHKTGNTKVDLKMNLYMINQS